MNLPNSVINKDKIYKRVCQAPSRLSSLYNEVNAETHWLPLQCKWRPNDNLHYLNKVIAITLRYSNEVPCFWTERFELAAPSTKHMEERGARLTLVSFRVYPLIQCDVKQGQQAEQSHWAQGCSWCRVGGAHHHHDSQKPLIINQNQAFRVIVNSEHLLMMRSFS